MKKLLIVLIGLLCLGCSDKDIKVSIYPDIVGTVWTSSILNINFTNEKQSVFTTKVDTFTCEYTHSQNFICFFYKEQLSTLFNSYIQYAKINNSTMVLHLMTPQTEEWTINLTQ